MTIDRTELNIETGETTTYTVEVVDKSISEYKLEKISEIKQSFLNATTKPIVDTGLGFSVDGGYQNKTDFETGKKYSFPQIRGANNLMYNVALADYDTIISAVELNGIALYQKKWALEAQIDLATTIAEVEAIQW